MILKSKGSKIVFVCTSLFVSAIANGQQVPTSSSGNARSAQSGGGTQQGAPSQGYRPQTGATQSAGGAAVQSMMSQTTNTSQQNVLPFGLSPQPGLQNVQPGVRQAGAGISANRQATNEKPVMKLEDKENGLLTIELRNVEIKDFLRVVANKYKRNFVIDKDVRGTITVSFSRISLDEALKSVLAEQELVAEKDGEVTKIRPNLVTKIFELRYIEATTLVAGAGRTLLNDMLSQDAKVYLGRIPNTFMVVDYPKNLEKVAAYLQMADRPKVTKIFKLKYLSAAELSGMSTAKPGGAAPTPTPAK